MSIVANTIWTEPITDNERQIIERVLREGDLDETQTWLRHCLKILVSQKKESGMDVDEVVRGKAGLL